MNFDTQYYKGIPLNLIDRKYGNRNAKRFTINHTNQNVWIPNKHLQEDGTIVPGKKYLINIFKRTELSFLVRILIMCFAKHNVN